MVQLFVVLILVGPQDTTHSAKPLRQKYGRQVLVNSVLGFACTIGAGVFYVKGNNAYEDYKDSQSMSTAVEAWDRVKTSDFVRNACAAGAVFFVARAVYYQIKKMRLPKSSGLVPVFEMRYAEQPKLLFGLCKGI